MNIWWSPKLIGLDVSDCWVVINLCNVSSVKAVNCTSDILAARLLQLKLIYFDLSGLAIFAEGAACQLVLSHAGGEAKYLRHIQWWLLWLAFHSSTCLASRNEDAWCKFSLIITPDTLLLSRVVNKFFLTSGTWPTMPVSGAFSSLYLLWYFVMHCSSNHKSFRFFALL